MPHFQICQETVNEHKVNKVQQDGDAIPYYLGDAQIRILFNKIPIIPWKNVSSVKDISHIAYVFDLQNLTRLQTMFYDWLENVITKENNPLSQLPYSNNITIVSLTTPDLSTNNAQVGEATGSLVVHNNGSNSEHLSGEIIIRMATRGSPIIQTIPINYMLDPKETATVSFDYEVFVSPGLPQEYIAEAYLLIDDRSPSVISLFHASNNISDSVKDKFSSQIVDLEEKSFELNLYPKSSALVATSSPGIELHAWDKNHNHFGMNYTTGIVDENIPRVTYSGYQSLPQWIKIVNQGNTAHTYNLTILGINAPDGTNVTVQTLIVNMSAAPLVYPQNITKTIANNTHNHIIITIESQCSSMEITNVSLEGTVSNITSRIWYNESSFSFDEQAMIDLTVSSPFVGTFTGLVNITYTTSVSGEAMYSIPTAVRCIDTPPGIVAVNGQLFALKNGRSLNVSCMVYDNDNVSIVRICTILPSGVELNVSMDNVEGTEFYYYNASYDSPGDYSYFIWANDTMGSNISSISYTFVIASLDEVGSLGFEMILIICAMAFIMFWKRRRKY